MSKRLGSAILAQMPAMTLVTSAVAPAMAKPGNSAGSEPQDSGRVA